jgi:outer membrane lipoprotein SlyB
MTTESKMKRTIITIASISVLTLGLSGCVSGLQGSTYSRAEARQVQEVEFGTVLSTSPVVIEGKQTGAGQLPGAVIGGVAGSSIGEGKGQQIFTILGAVGGAVVGSMLEEQATRTQGLELTIQMDSGKTLSIVQEVDSVDAFRDGQRVRVLTQGALARVSPE